VEQLYEKYKRPVYQLFHRYKNRDFIFIIPFVLLSLKVRLQFFFFLKSPGQSFPKSADSEWYLKYAYSLLTDKRISMHMDDIMYMGYNFLLTLLLAVFKVPAAVLFIQSVTAGLCVILVYKIARMLFNRTTAIIASYLYCYHTWPITLWSVYILSDSFFISLLLLCVYFLLKGMQSGKNVYKILFAGSALYLLVFRPTGIIALSFIMLYIVINIHRKTLIHFVKKQRLVLGGLLASVSIALIYVFISGMLDPLITSMQYNAKLILYNIYAKGRVYDSASAADLFFKPDYNIDIMNSLIISFIVNNWDSISIIYVKRMVAFLGRWVWETDLTTIRGIVKFADHMIPTLLFIIATVAALLNGLFRKAAIVWLIVLAVFIFCTVLFIDGMYRYKAPSIPFIVIVTAYGADRVIRGVIVLAKNGVMMLIRKRKRASYRDVFNEQREINSNP
jgi:hypothetical protein